MKKHVSKGVHGTDFQICVEKPCSACKEVIAYRKIDPKRVFEPLKCNGYKMWFPTLKTDLKGDAAEQDVAEEMGQAEAASGEQAPAVMDESGLGATV